MTATSQKALDFLADIQMVSSERYDIAMKYQQLCLDTDPNITTDVKYGGLVIMKGNYLATGLFFYKAHMSIEFGDGATFDDPDALLEGKGKHRRHIKIRTIEDLEHKQALGFIEQALTK